VSRDDEKRVAAEAAAELVEPGMRLGLGTGTTVAHLLPAIAKRELADVVCVSTSPATEQLADELGLRTASFADVTSFDLAIDGADQVRSDWWLVKGGGAAHTREKLVAAAAVRFVVIVDASKTVESLRAPVPLELLSFGLPSTVQRLREALGDVELRDVPPSPDGGVIADYRGEIGDPAELAARLSATPGVVEHGLFPPEMVSAVCVGRDGAAVWIERH
jgi:ribose 5-phosphate isomerase A